MKETHSRRSRTCVRRGMQCHGRAPDGGEHIASAPSTRTIYSETHLEVLLWSGPSSKAHGFVEIRGHVVDFGAGLVPHLLEGLAGEIVELGAGSGEWGEGRGEGRGVV